MALQMTATGTAVYKSDEQDFFIELRGLKSESQGWFDGLFQKGDLEEVG